MLSPMGDESKTTRFSGGLLFFDKKTLIKSKKNKKIIKFELQSIYILISSCIIQTVFKEESRMDFEKVKEIIVDSLSCDESQVTMEASLKDDLEADSLDAVELIMQIEEEFEVEIPDEVASNMKTVKDIVDYIEANK